MSEWAIGLGGVACFLALLGCGSSSGNGSSVLGPAGGSASGSGGQGGSFALTGPGGSAATAGSGGAGAGAGTGGSGGGSGSAGSAGALGDWSAYGCLDEKVHIVGTINGAAVDITHDVAFVGTGQLAAEVEFGMTGYGDQAFVNLVWPMNPSAAVPSPLKSMRFKFESPDPVPGIELCADGAADGLRETNRVGSVAHRLVEVQCPGTPVSGSLDVAPTTVSGTVDGMTVSVDAQYNAANASGQGTQWVATADISYQLFLTTDDLTGMATSGQITGGRLELSAPQAQAIYCVGSASFTRSMGAATIHLASLSKIGSCQTAPSIGSATVCAQSKLLVLP